MCTGDPAAAGVVEFDTEDDVDGDTCGVELVVCGLVVCGLAFAAACEKGSAEPLEARTTVEVGGGVDGGADAAASGACGLLQADRVAPARPRALAVSSDRRERTRGFVGTCVNSLRSRSGSIGDVV